MVQSMRHGERGVHPHLGGQNKALVKETPLAVLHLGDTLVPTRRLFAIPAGQTVPTSNHKIFVIEMEDKSHPVGKSPGPLSSKNGMAGEILGRKNAMWPLEKEVPAARVYRVHAIEFMVSILHHVLPLPPEKELRWPTALDHAVPSGKRSLSGLRLSASWVRWRRMAPHPVSVPAPTACATGPPRMASQATR
jgi:hypothetical protein